MIQVRNSLISYVVMKLIGMFSSRQDDKFNRYVCSRIHPWKIQVRSSARRSNQGAHLVWRLWDAARSDHQGAQTVHPHFCRDGGVADEGDFLPAFFACQVGFQFTSEAREQARQVQR